MLDDCSRRGCGRPCLFFFFFQAEDGIRDHCVTWSSDVCSSDLDTGAWGVVVPMVNTRAEAEAVVRAARYRPIGERSIGGQLHATNFDTDAANYYARANDEILVIEIGRASCRERVYRSEIAGAPE